jgi:hypothetical protein
VEVLAEVLVLVLAEVLRVVLAELLAVEPRELALRQPQVHLQQLIRRARLELILIEC